MSTDEITQAVARSHRQQAAMQQHPSPQHGVVAAARAWRRRKQQASQSETTPVKTPAEVEAEQAPTGWTRGEACGVLWPLVRPLVSWVVVLGYVAVWWAVCWAWPAGSSVPVGVWAALAHAAAGAGVVALSYRRLARRWATYRRRVLIGSSAALGWVVVALAAGPSYSVLVAGWLVMLAVTARYWQRRRPDYPDGPSDVADLDVADPPEPDAPATQIAADWMTYGTKIAPGSRLEYLGRGEWTEDYTLHLARDQQLTRNQVMGKIEEIARALAVMPDRLLIEPEAGRDASPLRLNLKYIHTPPTDELDYTATGPQFENGQIILGPYADGIGQARLGLYADGGLWSTYIAGTTGSGKSRVAELIAIAAISDPINYPTVLLYVDPQEGASSPALLRHARKAIPGSDAGELAEALSELVVARQAANSIRLQHTENQADQQDDDPEEIGFEPVPCTCGTTDEERIAAMVDCDHADGCGYLPGVLVIIDESHRVLDNDLVLKALSDLAREQRKLGSGMVLLSQSGTLEDAFGGAQGAAPLRSQLLAGNCLLLRSQSKRDANTLGINFDPTTLPRGGYLVTNESTPGYRPVMSRARSPVDPSDPKRSIAGKYLKQMPKLDFGPVERYVLADWLDQQAQTSAVQHQVEVAATPEFRDFVKQQSRQRLGRSLSNKTGQADTQQQPQTSTRPAQMYIPTADELIAEAEAIAAAEARPAAAAPGGPRPGTRQHTRQQVHQHLTAGVAATAELARAVGVSDRHVRDLLGELEQAGQARAVARGRWEVVT